MKPLLTLTLLLAFPHLSFAQDSPEGPAAIKSHIDKLEADNAAIRKELAEIKQSLAARDPAASAKTHTAAAGPTPFPKDPADWPGRGVIRVFQWMNDNRNYFWQNREKKQGAIVFCGDSLTGNWSTLEKSFPKRNVANRGIGGDVTRGLLFRFQEDVLDLHPKAIVILIGSNDLSAKEPPAEAAANIADMLDLAQKHNPAMPIILCKIPPATARSLPSSSLNSRTSTPKSRNWPKARSRSRCWTSSPPSPNPTVPPIPNSSSPTNCTWKTPATANGTTPSIPFSRS